MGQSTSNFVKKCARPFTGNWGNQGEPTGNELVVSRVTPFVLKRQGSMFFDEEGDLAHEFYEEEIIENDQGTKTVMRRRKDNLRPQGEIQLPHPRLHMDLPIVLCEAPTR